MGEAKNNPTAQAFKGDNPAEALRKIITTPLTEEEGKKALAEVDVQVRQILMMRSNLDQQLAAAEFDRSIIVRRMMNPAGSGATEHKPQMEAPVGGDAEAK